MAFTLLGIGTSVTNHSSVNGSNIDYAFVNAKIFQHGGFNN